MGFYEQISKYYDDIFPVGTETLEFIREAAGKPAKCILDVACGTGGYALALAGEGYSVTAVDIDTDMISRAKKKAADQRKKVCFLSWDMRRIGQLQEKFDCIYCIGNSIVHLNSPAEIQEVLSQMYGLLKPGGTLVLQTINYDRIIRYGITELPLIRNTAARLEFQRNYRYNAEEETISFDTELRLNEVGNRQVLKNSVRLFALRSGDAENLLKKAGFGNLHFYGGFNRSEYFEDSFLMVMQAHKV